jgi:hypothetical protein
MSTRNQARKLEQPSFFPSNRLQKGEFKKSDEEPLAIDKSTRQDQAERLPSKPSKDWSDLSPREQEKKQRG